MNFSVLISVKTAISLFGGFVTLFLHPGKNGQDIMASEEIRDVVLPLFPDVIVLPLLQMFVLPFQVPSLTLLLCTISRKVES